LSPDGDNTINEADEGDLSLSTQQANETAKARAMSVRVPMRRPHLVSSADTRLSQEAVVEAAVMEVDAAGELSHSAGNFQESTARGLIGRAPAEVAAPTGAATLGKRLLDIVGAVVLGIVFAPLIAAIVLLMRRGGDSVIYRHKRVGHGGQTFYCLKFRTMVPNADQALRELLEGNSELQAEWVRDHKLRNDPRVTPLGRFLRRTSLDELPQLLNVLRGEMSLVGPRPVVREELLRYGRNVNTYLAAKPGITGLWQVTGRNNTDYRRRVVLDTYYVRNQNLLLDLYILAKTTGVVLCGKGAY
jgi:Undecaprenyl-phosphate galactose phosphotransferase WbaP